MAWWSAFAFLAVALSTLDFSYLVRRGILSDSIVFRFSPTEAVAVLLVAWLVVDRKRVSELLNSASAVRPLLLLIFATTSAAYFYATASGVAVPYSIEARVAIQGVSFLAAVALGVACGSATLREPDFLFRPLCVACALALLGVLWQLIYDGPAGAVEERLHGLSGEPKGLAIALVPLMFAVLTSGAIRGFALSAVLVFSGVALALTFSATAFVCCIVVGVSIMALGVRRRGMGNRRYMVISALLIVLFLQVAGGSSDFVQRTLGRVIERIGADSADGVNAIVTLPIVGEVSVDGADAPPIALLKDSPFLLPLGNGLGFETIFSYKYLDTVDSGFIGRGVDYYITPNLALLINVLNFGLAGVALLSLGLFRAARAFRRLQAWFRPREIFVFIFFWTVTIVDLFIYPANLKAVTAFLVLAGLIAGVDRRRRLAAR